MTLLTKTSPFLFFLLFSTISLAEVGLPPLSEYLKSWDMTWNVAQYKKDLPTIEALYHRIFK